MSYSFRVQAATKALALLAVAAKFDEVVAQQACHERDKAQAVAAATSFVDLVADDDSKDVAVNVNGFLSGQWSGSDVTRIEQASVGVTASLVTRQSVPV